ncbi:MAG: hypothetical protein IJZ76_00075 [Lachnospiraceae bacterium]|nr:hypothetical protein [Lachnospiraceae bacterium]
MDKGTKKGVIIIMTILLVIMAGLGVEEFIEYKNKFVYAEHLDDVVLSVDEKDITLRELGYYVYTVEMQIDKQARLYNPEDPLDYWNTRFNNGVDGAYISEMAREAVFGTCVCDLIYEQMALEAGYELTPEEKDSVKATAEKLYAGMSEEQKSTTGLTLELTVKAGMRKALVLKFASEYFEGVDFTGYSGYREELVSYSGAYYKEEILPKHEVKYETDIYDEMKLGRITTGYVVDY